MPAETHPKKNELSYFWNNGANIRVMRYNHNDRKNTERWV